MNKGGRPLGSKDKVVRNIEDAAKRCGRASLDALTEVVEDKSASDLARVLAAQTLLGLGYGQPPQRPPKESWGETIRRHGMG